jgi:hypothetical protein
MEQSTLLTVLSVINTIGLLLIGLAKAIKKSSCKNRFCSCIYDGGDGSGEVEEALSHAIDKIRAGVISEVNLPKLEMARVIVRNRTLTV